MIEYKPTAYTEFDCVGLYITIISGGEERGRPLYIVYERGEARTLNKRLKRTTCKKCC
jgi:hypothetical protein